jgi:protein TonB
MKVTVNRRSVSLIVLGLALLAPLGTRAAAIEPPAPVRTVSPLYPQEMRARKISGLVMVKVQIDEKGDVNDAVAVKSSDVAFEAPAVDALKRWKFKPASDAGKPVAIAITVPVKFSVEDAG